MLHLPKIIVGVRTRNYSNNSNSQHTVCTRTVSPSMAFAVIAQRGSLVLASSAPHWPALDDAPRWRLVLASSAPHWPALDDVVGLVASADETADVAADVIPPLDEATADVAADVIPDVDEAGGEMVDIFCGQYPRTKSCGSNLNLKVFSISLPLCP